ncbi:hypothetical protein HG531_001415 [Fusarium graminearum]|nr:hypothetical protein HG531_001415 [Fusarium graminearum]
MGLPNCHIFLGYLIEAWSQCRKSIICIELRSARDIVSFIYSSGQYLVHLFTGLLVFRKETRRSFKTYNYFVPLDNLFKVWAKVELLNLRTSSSEQLYRFGHSCDGAFTSHMPLDWLTYSKLGSRQFLE